MPDTTEQINLRKENVDPVVRGFALQEFKLKPLVMTVSSSSFKETFWQETATELTGGTGSSVQGVPRLSDFPYGEVKWTESSSRLIKFGMDSQISVEDERTAEFDVVARTLQRVGRAIANQVDSHIWAVLSESQSATNILSLAIAAGSEWDSATPANRDPLQNILNAMREILKQNFDVYNGGHLLLNPTDFANLMGNDDVKKVANFFTDDVTRNGKVGRILGLSIVVSNVVTDDYAMVCLPKLAVSYKLAHDLSTEVIREPGIKVIIRAWEWGVAQLHNPKAVCLISNTQA